MQRITVRSRYELEALVIEHLVGWGRLFGQPDAEIQFSQMAQPVQWGETQVAKIAAILVLEFRLTVVRQRDHYVCGRIMPEQTEPSNYRARQIDRYSLADQYLESAAIATSRPTAVFLSALKIKGIEVDLQYLRDLEQRQAGGIIEND